MDLQDVGEIDCKPVTGHYTGAGDELDVEDLYTKYKVVHLSLKYIDGENLESIFSRKIKFCNLLLRNCKGCWNFLKYKKNTSKMNNAI